MSRYSSLRCSSRPVLRENPVRYQNRIAQQARDNRRCLLAARRPYLPHVLRSDDLEVIGRAPPVDMNATKLVGQPVSPGIAEGRARVVTSLDEGTELQPGEVLVGQSADPSWTPLFLVAGALVLEQGGTLSHPAIVAREYGLPALVGVAHATERISDGQKITVNADAGHVVIGDA